MVSSGVWDLLTQLQTCNLKFSSQKTFPLFFPSCWYRQLLLSATVRIGQKTHNDTNTTKSNFSHTPARLWSFLFHPFSLKTDLIPIKVVIIADLFRRGNNFRVEIGFPNIQLRPLAETVTRLSFFCLPNRVSKSWNRASSLTSELITPLAVSNVDLQSKGYH